MIVFYGIHRTYDIIPTSIALWLNKYQIPTYCFMGKYLFMPEDDMDFCVVIGKTIKLPNIPNPSEEDVNKYHQIFMDAYQTLFDSNKEKYASSGANAVLEIY